MGNSFLLDYIINNFGTEHLFWKLYVPNLILSAIAYKLGFAKELPVLKSMFVYLLLAVGVYILTIFGILGFPIMECLIIVSLVLGIYRFRLHRERKAKNN